MRRVDSLEGPFTFGEGSPPTQPEPESKAKPPPSMEVMDSTADGAEPLRSVASNQLLAVHDPSDAKSDSCDDAEAKEAKLEAKEYHGEPGGAGITLGRAIPVSAADAKRRAGAGGHAPMAGAAGAPGGLGSNAMSPRAGGVAGTPTRDHTHNVRSTTLMLAPFSDTFIDCPFDMTYVRWLENYIFCN